MLIIPQDVRRRILSIVMDFIHAEDLKLNDDFPLKITHVYVSLIQKHSELPNRQSFTIETRKIKTTFFKLNTTITKKKFLENLLAELNREIKPILDEIQKKRSTTQIPVSKSLLQRLYVDDIDSFKKVKEVNSKVVKDFVPLKISEEDIKRSLADIIGERFVRKDWAGEKSDLYSSYVIYKGNRISTAFLLKGPSVKRLTIDKCGKRGNQLLRLIREPAQLFVVQHVGEIDTDVIELLERLVSDLSRKKNTKLYYCVMNGVDTARILLAYKKLKI